MTPRSLLVVDDDPQLREMVSRMLEQAGYKVAQAPDGKKASTMMKAQVFDLVVTDLLMPERDGLELIGEVRRRYPAMRIIAMSGGGRIPRDQYIHMAKGIGAHQLLYKPFDRPQLLGVVEKALA